MGGKPAGGAPAPPRAPLDCWSPPAGKSTSATVFEDGTISPTRLFISSCATSDRAHRLLGGGLRAPARAPERPLLPAPSCCGHGPRRRCRGRAARRRPSQVPSTHPRNPIGIDTMAGLPSGNGAAVLGDQTIGERMISTIEETSPKAMPNHGADRVETAPGERQQEYGEVRRCRHRERHADEQLDVECLARDHRDHRADDSDHGHGARDRRRSPRGRWLGPCATRSRRRRAQRRLRRPSPPRRRRRGSW